ncbi:MAG: potassium transporter TrkG [Planctomycetota bacterium]
MYVGLNVLLALILIGLGLSPFDAITHAFATMATGGFSTYNASLGHFSAIPGVNGSVVEYVVILFMILAGTNFTLLALCLFGQPSQLLRDIEWRTYIGVILIATVSIVACGMINADEDFESLVDAIRYGLFQVVSIITTTGYGTSDFDSWNYFSKSLLFVLLFVGGCAGSTGCGMKVIRHVLFVKILGIELEHSFHPKVVRLLRLGGQPVEDESLRHSILVYFSLILILFVIGFLFVVVVEPNGTWGASDHNKMIDSASAVASTLNNIGPGLGTVGATQNYGHFGVVNKCMFVFMMMLGRLEIFPVLVLLIPKFWRDQ